MRAHTNLVTNGLFANGASRFRAMTMVEVLIAIVLIATVFAAVVPQIRSIQNSWASKRANAEVIQNGCTLTDHLTFNLMQAATITAVSGPAQTNGYIEFENGDGDTMRYEIGANNYVQFGQVGSLSDVAGPVSQLQFTCYDAYDLDTPITDVDEIRCVKARATLTNPASLGRDQTFSTQAYIRSNTAQEEITKVNPLRIDATTGNTPALARIDATHYLCAYTGSGDDGWAVVLVVNPLGWTVTKRVPFEYDPVTGKNAALQQINATHYLCTYTGPQNDGWAVILTVNKSTWTVSKGTAFEFDATGALTVGLQRIDDSHYLCAYTGPGNDGWAVVLAVDAGNWTISMGTPFEFDTANGEAPALAKIDQDHYLCAYQGPSDDGWAVVLTVNTGNWSISKGPAFEFDTIDGQTPALAKIDQSHYLCAYSGYSDDGWAVVLIVDTGSWTITTKGAAFEYNTARARVPVLLKMDDSRYLCAYQGEFLFLWACVLNVDSQQWTVSNDLDTQLTPIQALKPDLETIDDGHYLCAYEDGTKDGWAAVLTVGEVKP